MIKKYIRGHSTRGAEVLKELEKLGGVNKSFDDFSNENSIYIIDHTNNNLISKITIKYLIELIEQTFDEIKLPEEFKPEEFVIITEKETKDCLGCMFEDYDNCITVEKIFGIDCKKKGIIYKLK